MLHYLKELDKALFLRLNGWHSSFWDPVMAAFSDKYFWVPFYALLLGFLAYCFRRRTYLLLLTIGLTIASADSFSAAILKPLVQRLRPCHDASLSALIHLVENRCGGQYGFVSSHAANSFGLAMLVAMVSGRRYRWLKILLFTWAFLVSYSRIYLGAHYPGDILGGALLGIGLAYGWAYVFRVALKKFFPSPAVPE